MTAEPKRCWNVDEPLYIRYHDEEWGVPVHDDQKLFEFLVLDGFQAGLSWWLILERREAFRAAFDGFNPAKVAKYTAKDIVTKRRIGHLDSEFVVVHGKPGQAIILSGRLWKIAGTTEEEVFLEPIEREEAGIPSWVGELIPVSTEVAQEVGIVHDSSCVSIYPSNSERVFVHEWPQLCSRERNDGFNRTAFSRQG